MTASRLISDHVFGYPSINRRYVDSKSNVFVIPRPNQAMHWATGNVISWHFTVVKLNVTSWVMEEKISLQVWRRQQATNYSLVGEIVVILNLSAHDVITLRHVKSKSIEFQAGDLIGFRSGQSHTLPYDVQTISCDASSRTLYAAVPEDAHQPRPGEILSFKEMDEPGSFCRIYSLFVSLQAAGIFIQLLTTNVINKGAYLTSFIALLSLGYILIT